MRYRVVGLVAVLAVMASWLWAHDLFIKLDTYFLSEGTRVRVAVLNGTFFKSENAIAPDRVADLSVVHGGHRTKLATTLWNPSGDSTFFTIETREAGTYVVGVSTKARELALSANDFNEYLEHDGIPDVLDARRRDGELANDVVEKYHKHVKAIFQVGGRRTADFGTVLGYPAELVPVVNPYELRVGGTLRVRALVDGVARANQLVIAGGEANARPINERSARTDANGEASFVLHTAGKWYVKFIAMERSGEADLDYESKWATLSFEVR